MTGGQSVGNSGYAAFLGVTLWGTALLVAPFDPIKR